MFKVVCAVSLLVVVATSRVAVAGDIVEVRVLVDDRPNTDGKGPTGPAPVDPPKDAKLILSIESLAAADGALHARCVINGKTIRLTGRVTANQDGTRRVAIEFSQRGNVGRQKVSTTLMLVPDQQRVIGNLTGSDGARLVTVRLKADGGPAEGEAE
jgi:hypothetical protein